jgi:prepilin-type N-terminal cleavage/methylation domain-containing protein
VENNKKAFTLIELLVVVIIIVILAAIALPQYTMAVEKTRAHNMISILSNIEKAQQLYRLRTGGYTLDFDELDIEMPPGVAKSTSKITYKKFLCILSTGDPSVLSLYSAVCDQSDGKLSIERGYDKPYFVCWADKTDDRANKICRILSGRDAPSASNSKGTRNAYNAI